MVANTRYYPYSDLKQVTNLKLAYLKWAFTRKNSKVNSMKPAALPPVIIIGMHRSGTSLLTRILKQFGMFLGIKRSRNEEAVWMNKINYWIFEQCSATWERPEGTDTLLSHPEICEIIRDYIQGITNGPASINYLGIANWLRYGSIFGISRPWGWKDPRNTYTLPFWTSLFPESRVIHITRHGVDVAQSLRVRHERACSSAINRYQKKRWQYVNNPFAPKQSGFAHSPRTARLDGGLELWKEYTSRAKEHVQELGPRAMEVRYEDMLQDPLGILPGILEFCGLDVTREQTEKEAARIQAGRAFAFRNNPELVEYASKVSDTLKQFGYRE